MSFNFNGVISALVTPFKNGKVDYKSLENLVDYQMKNGIQGFVINGTTGESPTLMKDEVETIFNAVKDASEHKVPLILGTGTNSTEMTIANNLMAQRLNADAVLVVVPYYNKPTQAGLLQHFKTVADASSKPIILYNVPSRTISALTEETIVELSKHPRIIGIKEASGNIDFALNLRNKCQKNFLLLSGDDSTFLDFMDVGGNGIISVMSNLMTKASRGFYEDFKAVNMEKAQSDFKRHLNLINAMYVESNPIPIKWMLWKKNIIATPDLRLPLTTMDQQYQEKAETLMRECKLL